MNIIHYSVSNNIISQKMAITYAKKNVAFTSATLTITSVN